MIANSQLGSHIGNVNEVQRSQSSPELLHEAYNNTVALVGIPSDMAPRHPPAGQRIIAESGNHPRSYNWALAAKEVPPLQPEVNQGSMDLLLCAQQEAARPLRDLCPVALLEKLAHFQTLTSPGEIGDMVLGLYASYVVTRSCVTTREYIIALAYLNRIASAYHAGAGGRLAGVTETIAFARLVGDVLVRKVREHYSRSRTLMVFWSIPCKQYRKLLIQA